MKKVEREKILYYVEDIGEAKYFLGWKDKSLLPHGDLDDCTRSRYTKGGSAVVIISSLLGGLSNVFFQSAYWKQANKADHILGTSSA